MTRVGCDKKLAEVRKEAEGNWGRDKEQILGRFRQKNVVKKNMVITKNKDHIINVDIPPADHLTAKT